MFLLGKSKGRVQEKCLRFANDHRAPSECSVCLRSSCRPQGVAR